MRYSPIYLSDTVWHCARLAMIEDTFALVVFIGRLRPILDWGYINRIFQVTVAAVVDSLVGLTRAGHLRSILLTPPFILHRPNVVSAAQDLLSAIIATHNFSFILGPDHEHR